MEVENIKFREKKHPKTLEELGFKIKVDEKKVTKEKKDEKEGIKLAKISYGKTTIVIAEAELTIEVKPQPSITETEGILDEEKNALEKEIKGYNEAASKILDDIFGEKRDGNVYERVIKAKGEHHQNLLWKDWIEISRIKGKDETLEFTDNPLIVELGFNKPAYFWMIAFALAVLGGVGFLARKIYNEKDEEDEEEL